MRKCRIGTAKFFTLPLLLYHTSVNLAGISDVDTYFVKKANADIITDSTGSYYVLPAIVDGEETTVKVDATITTAGLNNNANKVFVAANNVIKDKNDIITSFTDVKNTNTFSATFDGTSTGYKTGTVAANRVVLGLNYTGNKNTATFWAYNDKTNVYVVDENYKTITVSAVASVADDTNDIVYASADTNTKVLKDVIVIEVPEGTPAPAVNSTYSVTSDTSAFKCVNGTVTVKLTVNETVSGGSPAAVAATNGYVKFSIQTWNSASGTWNAATTATTAKVATMSTSGTEFSTFVAVPLSEQLLVTAEFTCDQASETFSKVLTNTNS